MIQPDGIDSRWLPPPQKKSFTIHICTYSIREKYQSARKKLKQNHEKSPLTGFDANNFNFLGSSLKFLALFLGSVIFYYTV